MLSVFKSFRKSYFRSRFREDDFVLSLTIIVLKAIEKTGRMNYNISGVLWPKYQNYKSVIKLSLQNSRKAAYFND